MEKDTKSKLLEAAEELFARKGLTGVSIRELAQAAGANSALISYHFGGKEGLYEAVLEKQFSPIANILETGKGQRLTPAERILFYAQQVAVIHSKAPFLTRFLMGEIINPTGCFEPVIRKYIQRVYLFLHDTLQEGIAKGEFRSDLHPPSGVISLAGIMNFYFISQPIFKKIVPEEGKERYVTEAVKIFLNGVKANGHE